MSEVSGVLSCRSLDFPFWEQLGQGKISWEALDGNLVLLAVKQGRRRISSQPAKRWENDDLTHKNGDLSSTNRAVTSKNVGL